MSHFNYRIVSHFYEKKTLLNKRTMEWQNKKSVKKKYKIIDGFILFDNCRPGMTNDIIPGKKIKLNCRQVAKLVI